ncbi:MAG TPA: MBL fold metallo-hydrolase [Myxococcota bacterium]|jgi:glyoxylase-like metal-dependent hydrolase (beta-lactamase superfamily II)
MKIQHFFDEPTATLSYVVWDEDARVAVLIDSLLDFDPKSGRTCTRSCEAVARFLDERRLSLTLVLDTHAHADHLTGMPFFRERYGARTGIGAEIRQVQAIFRRIFNLGDAFPVDGSQFDVLLREGDVLAAGPLRVEAIHTPGHTPACMSYRIGDALFVGDGLFMPDYGTARCDFPGGSAEALYDSIQRLYTLPEATRVFTCHDYRPGGRPLRFESTIGEQKRTNVQLSHATTRAAFIELRKTRDAGLEMPTLILPSIQVNIRAGRLPEPESNGISYLKIPLNGV